MTSLLRYLCYPLLMATAVAATLVGLRSFSEAIVLPVVCVVAAFVVMLLERVIPYEQEWAHSHGDVSTDLWHLTLGGALAEGARVVLNATLILVAVWLSTTLGSDLWPTAAPILLQLLLALVLAEFGGYWFHRLEHTTKPLWRLHSVHHSPTRLYWLNAFRFHPLDMVLSQAIAVAPLILLGAPVEVLTLYGVYAIVHSTMHHSNVDARLGPLNALFTMAEVHRWHHCRDRGEMSANYGAVLSIWDWVFGTRYLPKDRLVRAVGLDASHQDFPQNYLGQLKAPFDGALWRSMEERS